MQPVPALAMVSGHGSGHPVVIPRHACRLLTGQAEAATVKNYLTVQTEGKWQVRGPRGAQFRRVEQEILQEPDQEGGCEIQRTSGRHCSDQEEEMTKEYRTVPADEVFKTLSPERQKKINTRASELIAEEFALRELREAKQMTQEQVARKLGGRQVYVSRLEKRADMKLSTLRDYVKAIGGQLELVVSFPKGRRVKLSDLGAGGSAGARTAVRRKRTTRAVEPT